MVVRLLLCEFYGVLGGFLGVVKSVVRRLLARQLSRCSGWFLGCHWVILLGDS